MKTILKTTALLAVFASCAANAANFEFSYTFGDGSALTGTLSGDLSGAFVQNISNVHVTLNGSEFTGAPLYAAAWNPTAQAWDNTVPAQISTNAALNNFIFADANVPTDFGVSNYVYFTNDPVLGQEVFANNLNTSDIADDMPANASWKLQQVSSVPLPGASMLLLSSLCLLGRMRRFHKQH